MGANTCRRGLFIVLAATLSACIAAHAPEGWAGEKTARIAYLSPDTAARASRVLAVFLERMRQLGWAEGQNLVVDSYYTEGRMDRFPDLMRQALAKNPDVILTGSTPGALAAKEATQTVPIVVGAMGDPVQSGVVTNLAKPGGNLTALSTGYVDGFAGKWLELLLEVVPRAKSVAVLWNTSNPVVLPYRVDLESAAKSRGVKLNFIDVRDLESLEGAFRDARRTSHAAVVVCENLFIQNPQRVVELAAANNLPSVYCLSSLPRAGGLISYGVDLAAMYRRAAEQVDKVLRGANPGDLPVEQPSKYELVVNLRAAKALGITVPDTVRSRADEIIR
jgi:putative ABC transport system substrate-binding protein